MESKILVLQGAKHLDFNGLISKDQLLDHHSSFYKNGEISFQILEHVRNKEIVVIQSFDLPNSRLMELLLAVDALKRAGASYVTVILPYFPYCRMDKKHRSGQPISAKVVCDLLYSVNVDRIVTFDLHAEQIQGFTNNRIIFDHLSFLPYIAYYFKKQAEESKIKWMFCAPDAGAVKRTKFFASLNNSDDLCIISKSRITDGIVDDMIVLGDVNDRFVAVVDDMVDSGGTLSKAITHLRARGANGVVAVAPHGIFSSPASEVLHNQMLWVTNSLPKHSEWPNLAHTVDITPYLTQIIKSIFAKEMLASYFELWNPKTSEKGG